MNELLLRYLVLHQQPQSVQRLFAKMDISEVGSYAVLATSTQTFRASLPNFYGARGGGKKCEIWPRFSIQVALQMPLF